MAGLVSLLTRNPELADAANEAIVAPRAAINRTLMQRAIDRGEIPATANLDLLSTLSPALVSYRTLMLRKPVDRAFLISIIDNVVLPAARGTAQV
jgi:hypothetical protein